MARARGVTLPLGQLVLRRPEGAVAGPTRPILVVVAASGGALCAAVWTETVLGSLDQTFDDFHHHIRLITGASGECSAARGTSAVTPGGLACRARPANNCPRPTT